MTLTLLDWRRRTAAAFADVRERAEQDPVGALAAFREQRDRLFATHPDSPLAPEARAAFAGLRYWPHDPALRFVAEVRRAPTARLDALSLGGTAFPLERLGVVDLPVGVLEVYWIDTYGGGVFIPFRDETSGVTTYGGGRYLLDTVKGADLGGTDGRLILDFNYAYHPSCTYAPHWPCPLAPPANRLAVPIEAGERL